MPVRASPRVLPSQPDSLDLSPSLALITAVHRSFRQLRKLRKLLGALVNRRERGQGAMRNQKVPREALRRQEPQRESSERKKTGVRYGTREPGNNFGVIFQGLLIKYS